MTREINPNQRTKGYGIGAGLRKRFEMVSKGKKHQAGKPLEAASELAEQSLNREDKANGKSKPSTACENGARLRELLVRTGAIVTDATGKTAEAVINKAEENQEKINEERKKEEYEKYGGPPTLPEMVIHGIGDLGDVQLTRRDLLVGKPKEGAKLLTREVGGSILPWPLYKLVRLFGII